MGYFTDYPKHVFLILSNEFCERFSYYGMKAILVAYFTTALRFDDDTATALYHSFTVVCYFTPIIGAMIADGWLGKFKTILYLSLIYSLGNIVMTVTAIPIDGEFINWTPFIGLAIIAFGTGGIKPCVSAFGGDQFKPGQERQKDSFFSLFYMAINVGSLLSTVITPLIRNNVRCFGYECYAVAFAIPAGLMLVAIVLFVIGSPWYTKVPPGESILARMFRCIWTALRGKCGCCSKGPKVKKDHWLDYAEDKFDKRFIADLKDVMSVCWLFLPLPVFWALFDQQGSRWTLQAKSLNGNIGSAVMPYDMMQVMNALLVVLFVPLLESVIYPCLNKLKIPNRPLQRMGLGMVLAGTAFVLAGVLQVFIDNESPNKVAGTQDIRFNFLNSGPCKVHVSQWSDDMAAGIDIPAYENTEYFYTPYSGDTMFNFTSLCPSAIDSGSFSLSMGSANISLDYQVVISQTSATWERQYKNDFTPDYKASIRIYNALPGIIDQVDIVQNKPTSFFNISDNSFSSFNVTDDMDKFSLSVSYEGKTYQIKNPAFKAENGAVYTVMLYENITDPRVPAATQLVEIKPRGISIFLQVPQYAIMTFGECLFSVTGLGFAYTQAAPSMKSILTSIWLLTVAVGNVVVVIVAETGSALSQMAEFFLFAGIMFATTVVFIIMCFFYKYVEPRDDWSSDDTSSTSSGSSRSDRSNDDVSKMKKQDAMIAEETGVVLKKVKDVGDDGEKKKKLDSDSDSDSVKSAGSLTKF